MVLESRIEKYALEKGRYIFLAAMLYGNHY